MKVLLAECAGACYGVERALKLAKEEAEAGTRAQTLGPLIHNPQVVEQLRASGVDVANEPGDVDAECVIIRSHGVTPAVRRELAATDARIVDATCPHVLRAQKAARMLAETCATVVVVGEPSHPEVEGLVACALEVGENVVAIDSAESIPEALVEPVGVVVQTTQSRAKLDSVLNGLREQGVEPVVKDTICNATSDRQEAARSLASQVDAMVVIGGHNSSNTTRLFEICSECAPIAFHIEKPEELQKELFDRCDTVGVTAGASTPEDQIQAIVRLLESW